MADVYRRAIMFWKFNSVLVILLFSPFALSSLTLNNQKLEWIIGTWRSEFSGKVSYVQLLRLTHLEYLKFKNFVRIFNLFINSVYKHEKLQLLAINYIIYIRRNNNFQNEALRILISWICDSINCVNAFIIRSFWLIQI